MTSRRQLLQALGALPLLGACAAGAPTSPANFTPSGVPLRRVKVSDQRVIRTIAGLRPFRRNGFNVSTEKRGAKTLIHNYGHGGGGISLSWGTSSLAVELAGVGNQRSCAVIGAGVMGLTTARLAQDRGWNVTIYSKDLPPDTTSNVAGGQWSPTSTYDSELVTPAFRRQFDRAMAIAYRYFQNLVGPRYGVRWISNYNFSSDSPDEDSFLRRYADFYPQLRQMRRADHPFPVADVRHYDTMLIEPAIFLPAVMADFFGAGGKLDIREFAGAEEILALDEDVIFNCTGLGSHALFGDEMLMPVKGQLTFLLPQEEVEYNVLGNGGLYMFPRSDGILLGGTYERGEWSLEPDPEATRRIIDGHRAFFEAMDDPWSA